MIETTNPLLKILTDAGYSLDDAKKVLSEEAKRVRENRANALKENKEGNRTALIDFATSIRGTLETEFAAMLPGSHATFTVRMDKEGNVKATANDCHATGYIESIHVDSDGSPCFGDTGAEQAKNVRPRKAKS